jgi:hypothetical protein
MAKGFNTRVWVWIVVLFLAFLFTSQYHVGFWIKQYQDRCVECDPEDVLPFVEQAFSIVFPEDAEQIKVAKQKYERTFVHFLIRFSADPNALDMFLKSFPKKVEFGPCSRDSRSGWFLPKWFKKPIRIGKRQVSVLAVHKGNLQKFCIDTTNQESFVVYLQGFFVRRTKN